MILSSAILFFTPYLQQISGKTNSPLPFFTRSGDQFFGISIGVYLKILSVIYIKLSRFRYASLYLT